MRINAVSGSGMIVTLDNGLEDRNFLYILWAVLALFFIASLVITMVDMPREQHTVVVESTPRVARLIIEKPKPPKPVPRPAETKKPVSPKEVPPKPAKPREKKVDTVKQAREKAMRSGVLALKNQLADLENNRVVDDIGRQKTLAKATTLPRPQGSTKKLDATVTEASKGLDARAMQYELGQMQLEDRQTARIDSAALDSQSERAGGDGRSMEEIELIMDRNKGKLNALYNRALRRNPVLAGKFVIRMTIAPSGQVTACEIVSSELGEADLEKKLVTSVLLIQFPPADVSVTAVQYPIEFYPR